MSQFEFYCRTCGLTKRFDLSQSDMDRWQGGGELIQRVFPQLSEDDRELMISGTCGNCFDELIKEPDDTPSVL